MNKKFFAKVTVDKTAIYKCTMRDGTEVYSNRPGTLIPHSTITLDPQKVAKAQTDAAYIMQLFGKHAHAPQRMQAGSLPAARMIGNNNANRR